MEVEEARTRVVVLVTGTIVFVYDGTAVFTAGVTFNDRSHAKVAIMSMARNNKIFYKVEFPFIHNHSHHEGKTPPALEEFLISQMDSLSVGLYKSVENSS